jgi:hypothetical protein
MFRQICLLLIFSLILQLVRPGGTTYAVETSGEVRFPADSGVLDVTHYGAVPDDGKDDTAAIQALLDKHPSGNHVFYFPSGRYLVSSTLRIATDDGVTKRNILQGQHRDRTILRLMDDLDHRDAVIDYRAGPAQFFRNAVRDLTIDIGRGNPGATGLQFNASNQGTVSRVTIRSSDGDGRVGLDLRHSDEVGPLLIRQLRVVGFEIGIWTGWQTASQTFEDIELRNQTKLGWVNEASQSVFVHRLRSVNEVTAVWNARWNLPGDGQGKFLLVDAQLEGIGKASSREAIRNGKIMYLRDVRTPGYQQALVSQQRGFRGNGSISDDSIEEYWANGVSESRRGGPRKLFPAPDQSLHLEIQDPPSLSLETDLDLWDGPHRHGGKPNDGQDDTSALQAAIDSGATTVYLPRGTWTVNGTVKLHGAVQRLLGTEARLAGDGTIRIDDGDPDAVVIERLQAGGITYQHHCNRTVIFRHLLGWTYRAATDAPGDVFVEDVVGAPVVFRNQRVWARQLDIEGNVEKHPEIPAKLVNDGGDVWILGFKSEDDGTHVLTQNGGRTELLGALHVGDSTTGPRFITREAQFSAAVTKGGSDRIREIRKGQTREGRLGNVDLYAAFGHDAVPTIQIDNEDQANITIVGTWESVTPPPGGFLGKDMLRARPDSAGSIRYSLPIERAGRYDVALRWTNQISSPIRYSDATVVTVAHAGGTERLTVNQRRDGGKWNSVGRFRFQPGQPASITIETKNATGHVQADAVRLTPVTRSSVK